MRKIILILLNFVIFVGVLSASDDAPIGGQDVLLYGHPKFVADANSATGGGVFSVGSYSLILNPALTAAIQSPTVDLGYTGISGGVDNDIGSAAYLGASFPTRWGVLTAAVHIEGMEKPLVIGNIILGHLGFSRDVTENLYLGISLTSGGMWFNDDVYPDDTRDFYIAADVGAWYRVKSIGFLKDVRFALVMQNLGKTFNNFGPGTVNSYDPGYPGIFTPKAGVAANFVKNDSFSLGISADVAFPTFINIVVNTGLQAEIAVKDAAKIIVSAGWDYNLRESVRDVSFGPHFPYVGVGVKFSVNTSNNDVFKRGGFDQTDIDGGVIWQQLDDGDTDFHLFSIGASAIFGVQDTFPPEIKTGQVEYE